METLHINTSQNVALQYQVASIVERGLAVVVDWLILGGYTLLVIFLLDQFHAHPKEWQMIIIFGFPWTFYQLLCEILLNGASIGKRLLNLKVARLDGGQPDIGNYLLRWALRLVDALFFIGTMVMLFNGKGQRLGDIAAGTTVISLKQRRQLDETLYTEVADAHLVTFPEVARFTDAQMRVVRQVLLNRSQTRFSMQAKLADKFRVELQLDNTMKPDQLLHTLLSDYVFLTSR